MTMKVAFVAILMFLLLCHAANAGKAAPPEPAFTPPIKWPASTDTDLPQVIARILPPVSDPKVKKCLGEGFNVQSCMHEICTSFVKHRISLQPDCCKIIQQLKGDCYSMVFDRFQNPFFHASVTNHCEAAARAPSPKA